MLSLFPDLVHDTKAAIYEYRRVEEPHVVNFFSMEFLATDASRPPARNAGSPTAVLGATFIFRPTGDRELTEVIFSSDALAGRSDHLAKVVTAHPGWSDARIAAALREAGAKFGPDQRDQLLRIVPIEKLRGIAAGEIEVLSAEFWFRDRGSRNGNLKWRVEAKWHGAQDSEAYAVLVLEPFEGRLIMYARHPKEQSAGPSQEILR